MKYFLLFISTFLICSCSVQKRKYQKGYFVEWNHNKTSKKTPLLSSKDKEGTNQSAVSSTFTTLSPINQEALTESGKYSGLKHSKKRSKFFISAPDTCDVILFKDGSEIRAKVEEVGIQEIKYKRCDLLSGPVYSSKKTDVFMINYANGQKEVIKSEAPVIKESQQVMPYKTNKTPIKPTHPGAIASLVLGVLSMMLGFFLLMAAFAAAINGMPFVAGGVILICFILALASIVIGISSLIKIVAEPDSFKGRGPAITGIILATIVLFFTGLALFSIYF